VEKEAYLLELARYIVLKGEDGEEARRMEMVQLSGDGWVEFCAIVSHR